MLRVRVSNLMTCTRTTKCVVPAEPAVGGQSERLATIDYFQG